MTETPVCIIGAGPAGATTSMMLSKLGIKHVIVDKAIFPRDKICGDGLILYVFKVLKMIDPALLEKFIVHPAFLHSFNGKFHVNNSLNIDVDVDTTLPFAPIFYGKRIDFDQFMVEHIPSEFADLRLGVSVSSVEYQDDESVLIKLADNETIRAKVVVGAEGIQSIVSKKLAGNKTDKERTSAVISAYFEGLENLPANNEAEIRIIYKGMPLFFYIFPLPNGQANISFGGSTTLLGKLKINLKTEVEQILKTHPKVKDKFLNARLISEWRGWAIPCNFGHLTIQGNRFLLVGDAAGLANPFYKEGVGSAMMSGVLAAQQIERCLEANRFDAAFMQEYEISMQSTFGKLMKYSTLAFKATRYPLVFRLAVRVLKKKIESGIVRLIHKQSF